jgi:hypothetical protein
LQPAQRSVNPEAIIGCCVSADSKSAIQQDKILRYFAWPVTLRRLPSQRIWRRSREYISQDVAIAYYRCFGSGCAGLRNVRAWD